VQDLIQTLTADLRLSLLVLGAAVITVLILWELVQRWRARKADEAHVAGPDDVADVLVSHAESHPESAPPAIKPAIVAAIEPSGDADIDVPSMSARDDFDDRWASLLSSKANADAESSKAEERVAPVPIAIKGTEIEDDLPDEGVIGPAREIGVSSEPLASLAPVAAPLPPAATIEPLSDELVGSASQPVVRIEWPPEDQRRVVGLRIVGKGGERFTGASLRQALQGEGFVYGEMDIFHRPVADGRVLMSAASLTQPGTFHLDNMDASLFRGLNLFAVLPGPLPGRDAVDKLLLVGHTLAQRVRGELQDGRGQPLTEAKLAEMRREAGSSSH
jgi:FtsZ-interacting cell division protein ZipA